ncbi:MAG: YHYH protein [Chloroflexota bacterium]
MNKFFHGSILGLIALGIVACTMSQVATEPQGNLATATPAAGFDLPAAINPVDPAAIPIGDGNVSTSAPKVGSVYACQSGLGGVGGAEVIGPWVDTAANTWDSTRKVKVSGDVSWPNAAFQVAVSGDRRVISGNDLPVSHGTGVFPIAANDPAYAYDRNPNSIQAQSINLSLPANPTVAVTPICLPGGAIGILIDGVVLFNALDAPGRDAAVHETLDEQCDGHPQQQGEYHHHNVPSCILAQTGAANTSTLVGYAYDGFGIYVERDRNGNMLTNTNLDECHGRTGKVLWDGRLVEMYHYVATLEYPYTLGCYKGTPSAGNGEPQGGQNQPAQGASPGNQPPQEAIDACAGRPVGASCSVGNMTGTCQTPPNVTQLACVPAGGPP